MEDDNLIDSVEELRTEMLAQLVEHRRTHDRVIRAVERTSVVENAVAADVRRHDDDRVLEVDRVALTVGQTAVIENLQRRR